MLQSWNHYKNSNYEINANTISKDVVLLGSIVFSKKHFRIIKEGDGFIVYNMNKPFKNGHTHISNYNTAKYILNLAYHSSIPQKRTSDYLLQSIIRISTDSGYIKQIKKLLR